MSRSPQYARTDSFSRTDRLFLPEMASRKDAKTQSYSDGIHQLCAFVTLREVFQPPANKAACLLCENLRNPRIKTSSRSSRRLTNCFRRLWVIAGGGFVFCTESVAEAVNGFSSEGAWMKLGQQENHRDHSRPKLGKIIILPTTLDCKRAARLSCSHPAASTTRHEIHFPSLSPQPGGMIFISRIYSSSWLP